MRKRWVYICGEAHEVTVDYVQPQPEAPAIWGDLPAYESPASGAMIEGRRARREDFKRTGCRPWEGLDAEKAEAARQLRYDEARMDQHLDEAAHRAFYQMDPAKRRALRER